MKKILLLTATIATISATANAQVRFGPEVGVNMNSLHYDIGGISLDESMNIGLRAGVIADIPFGNLALQPGVFYSMKGGKSKLSFAGFEAEDNMILNYVEIPVLLQYKFAAGPGKIFVGLGPVASIGVSGKDKSTTNVTGTEETVETDVEFGSDSTQMKRTDFGLMVDAGYELDMGLYFRPFYNLGFGNLSNIDGFEVKTRTFGISVGYLFGKKD